jgi:hypothetical protein
MPHRWFLPMTRVYRKNAFDQSWTLGKVIRFLLPMPGMPLSEERIPPVPRTTRPGSGYERRSVAGRTRSCWHTPLPRRRRPPRRDPSRRQPHSLSRPHHGPQTGAGVTQTVAPKLEWRHVYQGPGEATVPPPDSDGTRCPGCRWPALCSVFGPRGANLPGGPCPAHPSATAQRAAS